MMKKAFGAVAAGIVLSGCCGLRQEQATCCRYPDSINEGFVSLFNGNDLQGWEGATAMYGVDPNEPGVLQCFPERKANGSSGNLYTTREYGNFILRFEFMMPENGNNGLGIRMS